MVTGAISQNPLGGKIKKNCLVCTYIETNFVLGKFDLNWQVWFGDLFVMIQVSYFVVYGINSGFATGQKED